MSLLDEYIEMTGGCILYDLRRVADGIGGYTEQYVESITFDAAITLNNSIQAKIAEKQGVTGLYTVTTSKSIALHYHDIFKRKSDNKLFRVTSNGEDNKTPPSATLDMRQVSAEEYTFPTTSTISTTT